jgi:hypothetical protein
MILTTLFKLFQKLNCIYVSVVSRNILNMNKCFPSDIWTSRLNIGGNCPYLEIIGKTFAIVGYAFSNKSILQKKI